MRTSGRKRVATEKAAAAAEEAKRRASSSSRRRRPNKRVRIAAPSESGAALVAADPPSEVVSAAAPPSAASVTGPRDGGFVQRKEVSVAEQSKEASALRGGEESGAGATTESAAANGAPPPEEIVSGSREGGVVQREGASASRGEIVTSPAGDRQGTPQRSPPESATLVGSGTGNTLELPEEEEEDAVAVVPANDPPAPLPLSERVPAYDSVLDQLRKCHSIRRFFQNSLHLSWDADSSDIFECPLWEDLAEMLHDSILKYTPTAKDQVDKNSRRYEKKLWHILDRFVAPYEMIEIEPDELMKQMELDSLQIVLGWQFVYWFQRMITPPRGQVRVPMADQIEALATTAINKKLDDLFENKVAEHVYYIVGFLCNAGMNEADRRGAKSDVGKCIKSLNSHFALESEVDKLLVIKADLPLGVTNLADSRKKLTGLKYPDAQLYTAFAVIEDIYASMANAANFEIFGGSLLREVIECLLENSKIRALLHGLFDEEKFSEDEVTESSKYYMGVYGNVRSKDVAYRINSNIQKGATVGLRQTLSAGGRVMPASGKMVVKSSGKSVMKIEVSKRHTRVRVKFEDKKKTKGTSKILRTVLPMSFKREWNMGECYAAEEEPEDEPAEEACLTDENQHAALLKAASEPVEESPSQKLCTINSETEEYMGKDLTVCVPQEEDKVGEASESNENMAS